MSVYTVLVLHTEINKMSSRQPTSRAWHAAVGVGGKLFVWGGRGDGATTLERFDVSSLTWEELQQLKGSLPEGLHDAAVTAGRENFYSFGGSATTSGRVNTLYEISPSTLLCRELLPNSPSHTPQKQMGSRSVHFKNKVVVYGGSKSKGYTTNDLHVFDLEKSKYDSIKLYSCIGSVNVINKTYCVQYIE